MNKFLALWLLLSFTPTALACHGPQTETAQDSDASVLFEGAASAYEIAKVGSVTGVTTGSLAKVTFQVRKTLKGESKKTWVALLRGMKIPANLKEFEQKFGKNLKVGLRDLGKVIDQAWLPPGTQNLFFVVDAACSMHGEDWLLRKVGKN